MEGLWDHFLVKALCRRQSSESLWHEVSPSKEKVGGDDYNDNMALLANDPRSSHHEIWDSCHFPLGFFFLWARIVLFASLRRLNHEVYWGIGDFSFSINGDVFLDVYSYRIRLSYRLQPSCSLGSFFV
jgi:hypothetical protein